MILVTITINGTVHRVSDEHCHLTHQWQQRVISVEPPNYEIRGVAGGYVEPLSGAVTFDPALFVDDWPPPASCAVTISITDTTEEAAATIFNGYAHRQEYSREGVKYGLYGTSHTATLASSTYIDDTLLAVFTTYCGASYLNLTLDHTYDRATSPNVYAHFDADTPIIDMLSALAEAVNHLFYIKGSTLYLVDMLLDNGATAIEPAGRYYPVTYHDPQPYKQFSSIGVKKYSVSGSYGYGAEEFCDAASGIEHIYGRVGDNTGDDEVIIIHTAMIPYETGKYYMMKVKARQTAGSGTFHAGFAGVASDRTTWINASGVNSFNGQHRIVAASVTLTSSWEVKTGYASGWAAPGTDAESPLVSSPGAMYTNVAYIRPWIRCHYSAQSGKTDLDFIAIYEVDSSGDILEELFYDDFTNYGTARHYTWGRQDVRIRGPLVPGVYSNPVFNVNWVRYLGSGNRETISSVNESTTNVEAALTNRKTILEKPRATIRLDLTAANLPQPGQSIEWTDEIVSPDGAASIAVAIRARNISFDLDSQKIIIEGEGSIT